MAKGYICIIIAASLWGLIGPVSKLVFREGLEPLEAAFWRAILAWGFFAVHAFIKNEIMIRKQDIPGMAFFGLTGVSLFYGAYQTAVSQIGAAAASVLLYTAPAYVAVMSRIFFKEKMTRVKLAALILTFIGVAGVCMGSEKSAGTGLNASGLFFGLLSGFCYALHYIFGKHFSGRYSSPNLFLYILPVGALGLLPWIRFSHKSPLAWAALICLAFICTYAAYYFYYIGLKYLESTRAAVVATIEPVVAAGLAYIWWKEYFTFIGYAGSVLILAGVVLMIRDGLNSSES